jgi:hypothetical protein
MPLPHNHAEIEAIAERVRGVLSRQPDRSLDELASILHVSSDGLRLLIEEREHTIDAAFLVETVAALVREFAVDPQWLLTGRYDANAHRRALTLGEDRTDEGHRALRDFVREQYQRLRDGLSFLSAPSGKPQE